MREWYKQNKILPLLIETYEPKTIQIKTRPKNYNLEGAIQSTTKGWARGKKNYPSPATLSLTKLWQCQRKRNDTFSTCYHNDSHIERGYSNQPWTLATNQPNEVDEFIKRNRSEQNGQNLSVTSKLSVTFTVKVSLMPESDLSGISDLSKKTVTQIRPLSPCWRLS